MNLAIIVYWLEIAIKTVNFKSWIAFACYMLAVGFEISWYCCFLTALAFCNKSGSDWLYITTAFTLQVFSVILWNMTSETNKKIIFFFVIQSYIDETG